MRSKNLLTHTFSSWNEPAIVSPRNTNQYNLDATSPKRGLCQRSNISSSVAFTPNFWHAWRGVRVYCYHQVRHYGLLQGSMSCIFAIAVFVFAIDLTFALTLTSGIVIHSPTDSPRKYFAPWHLIYATYMSAVNSPSYNCRICFRIYTDW